MATDASEATERTRRPTQRAAVNREALLVAARDLFAHHGPAAVSIRTVAERAGCSHTLVGRQFGSKAGLEAAVVERLAVGLQVLTTRQCSSDDWPMAPLV
jgi:AcrR family transcriptional regulator